MLRNSFSRLTFISALAAISLPAVAQLPTIRAEDHITGVSSPLAYVQDPSNPAVQYIVEKGGRIRVVQNGSLLGTDFINLSSRVSSGSERGLLGLAFPPDYGASGMFYVNYTNLSGSTHIARYRRNVNNPLTADFNSEEVLMVVGQPFSNHNAGNLAFGPDGYLYIGLGDGGSGGDPGHRSQTPSTLLGKMLRIDVSNAPGYVVPADNPFIDDDPVDALHEIWAFGLRNPWRYSFDDPNLGGTGALIIADVGQNAWEEINYEPANSPARNYGWRNKEGFANFNQTLGPAYLPLTDPIHVYSHGTGRSVTGGFVYRGTKLGSQYQGRYFFADYVFRRVWSLGLSIDGNGEATVTNVVEHTADLGGSTFLGNIASFGVDSEGELYLCSFNGKIIRIVPEDNTDLTDYTITVGTENIGTLQRLRESDNFRVRIQSEFGFSVLEPDLTEIVVGAATTVSDPLRLDLTIEDKIDHPTGTVRVWLRDWNAGFYDQVQQYAVNTTETSRTFESIPNPADYVRDSDGRVQVRLRHVVLAVFSAFGFETWIDQVKVDVY